MITLLTVNQ